MEIINNSFLSFYPVTKPLGGKGVRKISLSWFQSATGRTTSNKKTFLKKFCFTLELKLWERELKFLDLLGRCRPALKFMPGDDIK